MPSSDNNTLLFLGDGVHRATAFTRRGGHRCWASDFRFGFQSNDRKKWQESSTFHIDLSISKIVGILWPHLHKCQNLQGIALMLPCNVTISSISKMKVGGATKALSVLFK